MQILLYIKKTLNKKLYQNCIHIAYVMIWKIIIQTELRVLCRKNIKMLHPDININQRQLDTQTNCHYQIRSNIGGNKLN